MIRFLIVLLFSAQAVQANYSELTSPTLRPAVNSSPSPSLETQGFMLSPEDAKTLKTVFNLGKQTQGDIPEVLRTASMFGWSELQRMDCVQLGGAMAGALQILDSGSANIGREAAEIYRENIRGFAARNNCAG